MATTEHTKDSDCTVDPEDNCCVVCGVEHGTPCPDCGGRGFHVAGCPWTLPELWYDYTNQAWVRDGRYIACSHPAFACDCYGTQHEGEKADPTLCLQR